MKQFKNYLLIGLIGSSLIFTSCGDDEVPPEEDELEVITDVALIFTNTANASDVVRATAQDPDDDGPLELVIDNDISLTAGATYTLTFEILNNIADDPDEQNIGAEILEEDDEHQIFFEFTAGAFTDPTGNGNVDGTAAGDEAINYEDEDSDAQDGSGNPVGLITTWTAGAAQTGSSFRVILMHQPPVNGVAVKTATSGVNDGEPDFNLLFNLDIE